MRSISLADYARNKLLKNDLMITKSSGSFLHIGKVSIVNSEMEKFGYCCSNFMQRLQVSKQHFAKYFWYLLGSEITKEQFTVLSNTTTGLNNLAGKTLDNIVAMIPPLNEQQAIAAFLDAQCGRIDSIIAELEQQIAILKSYKTSLIAETVTKGLNKAAPMKDSGIDWIGDIPAHWEVKTIKYVYSILNGNGFPIELQGSDDGDVPFFKVSDINGEIREVDVAKNYVCYQTIKHEKWNIIPEQSILMAKIGAALLKNHRKINVHRCLIDNNMQALVTSNNVDLIYSYFLFTIIDMEMYDNGGPIPSINTIKLLNQKIPLPPPNEQQAIAAFLDTQCTKTDDLIAEKRQSIETMRAYKKALIYEYVTGKKRVAGSA
jgi:type I restriction enzyme S subunit